MFKYFTCNIDKLLKENMYILLPLQIFKLRKKMYQITFEETEIEQASKLLKITKKEFMDKYIEETTNGYDIKGKPCCFLTENGACEIEKCKPEGCREYPFTNRPERLLSLLSIVDFASVCPVVFEMLERLKKTYGFKRRGRY
ncbi:YkgJ family cysteine cluster protein [Clostridium magnum]|nr:YkgJ family cysteine cluster protein [Clostridium magnum]SHI15191.1 Putative zinc-or iron-chelating domain-containing protein [Clostridium magnum DSM 2767]